MAAADVRRRHRCARRRRRDRPQQPPVRPALARPLRRDAHPLERIHERERDDAADVLVVGCGNSGAEIAVDLADAGKSVRVAVRTPPAIFRRDTAGIPSQPIAIALWRLPTPVVDPIAKALRRLTIPDLTRYGLPTPTAGPYSDYLRRGVVPIVDTGFVKAVKERRLEVVATVDRFDNGDAVLADGTRLRPDLIVAATGYRT